MLYVYGRWRWLKCMALILAIFAALELALMLTVGILARSMDSPHSADAMIVLGGGLNPDGTPMSTLAYRLDRAAELYAQCYSQNIIVSGGQSASEKISEAQSMQNYLSGKGVPAQAIILEADSTNTEENMRYSKAIMDERGFKSALIVTSDYHLWRALRLAHDAGITAAYGAGAKNSSTAYNALKNIARETISWIKYFLA